MRRTGWIVIAAFVAVPALMFGILWSCWRGGMFDSVPAHGTVRVSALFRTGDTIECDLAPVTPGYDLVRWEAAAPVRLKGEPPIAMVRVWQRPIVLGKRRGRGLQVKVQLLDPAGQVGVLCYDDVVSVIWPPPTPASGD
ncbi:MAG: hypothetical protein ACYTGX_00430 [Planctomycetota bacterium]|jgi:hypothetical protein